MPKKLLNNRSNWLLIVGEEEHARTVIETLLKVKRYQIMKIAFWNTNNKDLSDLLVTLTLENDIDILCLAEADSDMVLAYLRKINIISKATKTKGVKQIFSPKNKVIILSRYDETSFDDKSNLYSSKRLVAQKITIPTKLQMNLIVIHFHSKNNWSDVSLAMECATVSNAIAKVEYETKNSNTIVIGDFNMNPFESGMIAANGLHAISDLDYALKNKKGREIDETYYPFFYNPMWNFFGDFNEPFGTYYYRSSTTVSYEWHIFDQVIFRPEMKQYLDKDYIKIINWIGTESLINSLKRPDKAQYSDHLPIIFKLIL